MADMHPPLTDSEMATLRKRANGEQDGLLNALLDEVVFLRAAWFRLHSAGERLLAETETIELDERG
jgi:hypothetical protein